jgi:hypothetical protein
MERNFPADSSEHTHQSPENRQYPLGPTGRKKEKEPLPRRIKF